jgi:hypothetical protein
MVKHANMGVALEILNHNNVFVNVNQTILDNTARPTLVRQDQTDFCVQMEEQQLETHYLLAAVNA